MGWIGPGKSFEKEKLPDTSLVVVELSIFSVTSTPETSFRLNPSLMLQLIGPLFAYFISDLPQLERNKQIVAKSENIKLKIIDLIEQWRC